MTAPVEETRTVDIKGRQVDIHQLKDMQLMFMAREARKLLKARDTSDENAGRDILMSIGRVLDILESAVIKSEDREYLMDLTVQGHIELKDMLQIMSAFSEDGEEAPKPRVRRGRPPTRKT